jgi:hypothetical protein
MNKAKILENVDKLKELILNIDKESKDFDLDKEYNNILEVSNLLTQITSEWSSYITGDLIINVIKKISV